MYLCISLSNELNNKPMNNKFKKPYFSLFQFFFIYLIICIFLQNITIIIYIGTIL